MPDIYQVRAEKSGMFSIYKNDHMIVFNLDSTDIRNFCKEQKNFSSTVIGENSADFDRKKPFDIYDNPRNRSPGRGLILAPHINIVRSMVAENPSTTVQDVERHLRGLGIKFAAKTAVTNLARKHGIKLAA